jgi:hypothetical protein
MGREIFYCANCGARILPEEFESGEAIALNNQNYCPNCKPLVAPEMPAPAVAPPPPAEDSPSGSSALRRVVRAPLPTMTTGRGGTGLVGRRQTTGSPARAPAVGRGGGGYAAGGRGAPPAKNNTVIYIVAGAGVVVLLLIIAMASGGKKQPPRRPGGGGSNRPAPQQPVVKPPTKADFEKLRSEVYDFLKNGRKEEARSRVSAYKSRFPGFDLDKLRKLSDEIEVW